MLIGEHKHTKDNKNRLSLPARFRKILGKNLVITKGLDKCLFIYSLNEWDKFTNSLKHLSMGNANSRALSRFLISGATPIQPDSAGRILIPEYLVKFAKLNTNVTITGMLNRIELWNEDAWQNYQSQTEKNADNVAEKLSELGII